ncbi:T9SS type A sorting domain-containing protein [Fibrobacter sp. UWEL]|uniref:T9SS type A sorting domain-containing protein n=1 Tax=Fibrobacter sp. UWEL TaxID=1896209 RepID=UPI00091E8F09|nr:T9SS type A sorting domain-containing protein [Fibrobacter sp. UWEL]SHL05095.1 Por secretion system C-terminal sorting domain-containing protein [Fibrobacter sp. UWEL]
MNKSILRVAPMVLSTALCTTAFAYTVQGTVTSKADGKAIADASVSLLQKGKSAKTDQDGKFTIHEDEQDTTSTGIHNQQAVGFVNLSQGVLHYSQSSGPVQVKVFDLMGNLVSSKTLYGTGSVDLRQGINAKGTYFAKVHVGSATQNIKFTTDGNASAYSTSKTKSALLKAGDTDKLQVIADGYDTLNVTLNNLDTTLALSLEKSIPPEPTYKFGYALKNTPTPSKGCGTNTTLKTDKKVENGEHHVVNVNGTNREYFITLPTNYDNTKQYKLLIALHCYGSSAEDFVHHTPDYDHPTPYYGQQVLDKNGDYIFASLQAVGGLWNKGQEDHDFFGKALTTIEDNYCIDTSRVFITGFSYGAMFSYSLAQDYQDRVRAAATYAVADYNIWLPQEKGMDKNLPIAWMNVHGVNDDRCTFDKAKNSALPRMLKKNGKASDGDSQFTDASSEILQENQGSTGHLCYDFKNVDERFPIKFCTWPGGHQWTAHDTGNMSVGWNWESTWVPEEVHKFFEQF